MAIFPTFLFWKYRPGKSLLRYSRTKKAFLTYNNKNFKNSKNWHFSKGVNAWFWSKNGHFSNFFFFGTIGQENVFYDILDRKNALLGYKNNKFKQWKNWHVPKLLTHDFGPKMVIFPIFFLGKIGQGNVFYYIVERKNAFLGYKTKKSKKSKNWHFPKRVNPCFWLKNGHSCNFLFWLIYSRKMSFMIL